MSNRRRPRTDQPPAFSWLLCPDCNSTVHEVWRGKPPRASLCIEVAHSETCPAWRFDGREVAIAFLPKSEVDQ